MKFIQENEINQAVIFDLDGLIINTEVAGYHIWLREFRRAGLEFDKKGYQQLIGTHNLVGGYRPHEHLAAHLGNNVSARELRKAVDLESIQAIEQEGTMPGVLRILEEAKRKGIKLAVGSSSGRKWVHGHLQRLGIFDDFDTIVTSDDTEHAKPEPDIYLKVLENLNVAPENALVLEDSYNGVLASHRAGIRVIAVPNEVTTGQDFSLATAILPSLEALNLAEYFPNYQLAE